MPRFASTLALTLPALALSACGGDQAEVVPIAVVRGAPIDGSGDAGFDPVAARVDQVEVARDQVDSPVSVEAGSPAADGQAAQSAAQEMAADASETTEASEDAGTDAAELADVTDTADATDAAAEDEVTQDEPTQDEAAAEAPRPLEPDEDGIYHLAFSDLSLEGEDVDNIIDYLLFPDEFEEGEGFQFPDHIKALDGKEITISGYMIPGRIRKNMVKDFMLVRDLAGCCFGGAPNPDEWIDVVMKGDAQAEYLRYLPIKVHGTLKLIGEQDQEGYAVGVYRMEATWAGEED